jgi:hypothetical protein
MPTLLLVEEEAVLARHLVTILGHGDRQGRGAARVSHPGGARRQTAELSDPNQPLR